LVKLYTFLKNFQKTLAFITNVLYNQSLYLPASTRSTPLKAPIEFATALQKTKETTIYHDGK